MLLTLILLAGAAGAYFFGRPGGSVSTTTELPESRFASAEEAKREVVRLYPAVGQSGSALNREFVSRYQAYRAQQPAYFDSPDWPMRLVKEILEPSSTGEPTAEVAPEISDALRKKMAVLQRSYPKVDAKKFPASPADSLWLFRSSVGGSGTVEVGFQGSEVVYMIFRRGVGGSRWTPEEIDLLRTAYAAELLQTSINGAYYRGVLVEQINAAAILRSDFDAKRLRSGS